MKNCEDNDPKIKRSEAVVCNLSWLILKAQKLFQIEKPTYVYSISCFLPFHGGSNQQFGIEPLHSFPHFESVKLQQFFSQIFNILYCSWSVCNGLKHRRIHLLNNCDSLEKCCLKLNRTVFIAPESKFNMRMDESWKMWRFKLLRDVENST